MGSNPIFRSSRSGGIGRRDSLKNCWGATPVLVRARPSALNYRRTHTQRDYPRSSSDHLEEDTHTADQRSHQEHHQYIEYPAHYTGADGTPRREV